MTVLDVAIVAGNFALLPEEEQAQANQELGEAFDTERGPRCLRVPVRAQRGTLRRQPPRHCRLLDPPLRQQTEVQRSLDPGTGRLSWRETPLPRSGETA
jgi:hypothetical protein